MGSFPDLKINATLLGKVFGDSASSTSVRLKRLEEEGLVETGGSDDQREKYIRLTDEGEKQYHATCLFLYGNTQSNPIDFNR